MKCTEQTLSNIIKQHIQILYSLLVLVLHSQAKSETLESTDLLVLTA